MVARTAKAVREEAYRLARFAAELREETGDPEGAEVIRELASDIKKIRLTAS